MKDLHSPKLMWLKAVLLLAIGATSALMVWLEARSVSSGLLMALAIWAFCRAYYFAFHVLERYADPQFRYAGLWSVLRYAFKARKPREPRP